MLARRWQASRRFFPSIRRKSPADLALFAMSGYDPNMPDRTQRPVGPAPWGPQQGDGGGPKSPDVSKPDTKDLLQRMRKVDPNQSKRYRQRTGQ
jgi:hypothetical protein